MNYQKRKMVERLSLTLVAFCVALLLK